MLYAAYYMLHAEQEAQVASHELNGETVLLMAIAQKEGGEDDGRGGGVFSMVGAIAVRDELKSDAAAVVNQLRRWKKVVWIVTGDNERTAAFMAKQAGVEAEFVVAGVKPEGKSEHVQKLQVDSGEWGAKSEARGLKREE